MKQILLSNKAYDVCKYIAAVFLPAIAAFYTGMAGIWQFPNVDKVVGTITLTDTLLGALLLISSSQYQKKTPPVENEGIPADGE